MKRLRLRLIRWLAGRDFIDPLAHPVLSKHPEIIGCQAQNWIRLSELAPGQGKAEPFLRAWHLVSTSYSEELANQMGVTTAEVIELKKELLDVFAKGAEFVVRGF